MVARLQMRLKKKLIVVATFGFRIPWVSSSSGIQGKQTLTKPPRIIIFIAMHLWEGALFMNNPGDPTFNIVTETIWNEVIAHYSIVACTSFCLTPFMKATRTNWGEASRGVFDSYNDSRSPRYNSSKGEHTSFALKSLTKPIRVRRSSGFDAEMTDSILSAANRENAGECFRRDDCISKQTTVSNDVLTSSRAETSIDTDESRKMYIKRDIDFSIQYAPRAAIL